MSSDLQKAIKKIGLGIALLVSTTSATATIGAVERAVDLPTAVEYAPEVVIGVAGGLAGGYVGSGVGLIAGGITAGMAYFLTGGLVKFDDIGSIATKSMVVAGAMGAVAGISAAAGTAHIIKQCGYHYPEIQIYATDTINKFL